MSVVHDMFEAREIIGRNLQDGDSVTMKVEKKNGFASITELVSSKRAASIPRGDRQ